VAVRLARGRIAQVKLDDDSFECRERIVKSPRSVRERTRVDDDRRSSLTGAVHLFDQFTFAVRLVVLHGEAESPTFIDRRRHVVGEMLEPIDLRLTVA
jgi:hypothetical protein